MKQTFKQFLESRPGIGPHGENANDQSEKTMVNKIIAIVLHDSRIPKNYDRAYDFLESSWGGFIWDKYYELFNEKHADFEGPFNMRRYEQFKKDVKSAWASWLASKPYSGPQVDEEQS